MAPLVNWAVRVKAPLFAYRVPGSTPERISTWVSLDRTIVTGWRTNPSSVLTKTDGLSATVWTAVLGTSRGTGTESTGIKPVTNRPGRGVPPRSGRETRA